jgi:hypothetical protein
MKIRTVVKISAARALAFPSAAQIATTSDKNMK